MTDALQYVHAVVRETAVNRKDIVVTGHSLGGGLAQYVGVVTGAETHTFNAPAAEKFVSNLQKDLQSPALAEKLKNLEMSNITNHVRGGDIVSDFGGRHLGRVVVYEEQKRTEAPLSNRTFGLAGGILGVKANQIYQNHRMDEFREDLQRGAIGEAQNSRKLDGALGVAEKTWEFGFVKGAGAVGGAAFGPVGKAAASATAQGSYYIGKNYIAPYVAPTLGDWMYEADKKFFGGWLFDPGM